MGQRPDGSGTEGKPGELGCPCGCLVFASLVSLSGVALMLVFILWPLSLWVGLLLFALGLWGVKSSWKEAAREAGAGVDLLREGRRPNDETEARESAGVADTAAPSEPWQCACGQSNDGSAQFCTSCGTPWEFRQC